MTFRIDIVAGNGEVLRSWTWVTDEYSDATLDVMYETTHIAIGPAMPFVFRIRRIL
jgi:hypothetical protein